jgi:transposase-like protein
MEVAMSSAYHDMSDLIRTIERADPLERARMATDLLKQLDSLTRRTAAVRDRAVHELLQEGDSYAAVAECVGLSKAMVAKIHDMAAETVEGSGRSRLDVKRMAALIPRRPLEQSLWKDDVCLRYGHGEPIAAAVEQATATLRKTHPGFEPLYDPAILAL